MAEAEGTAEGRIRADAPRGARLRLEGPFDWSGAAAIVWEARAASAGRVRVTVEHGAGRRWTFYFVPKPGLRLRVAVSTADLQVRPRNTSHPGYFTFGGGPDPVDLASVRAVVFAYDQDGPPADLEVRGLRASAGPVPPAVLDPRPVVDGWGQWTGPSGAPRTEPQIRAAWAAEDALPGTPCPDRSRWGGLARHRLEATGRFRTARLGGRWCLVDPDGHPFFSVGPDVLVPSAPGPCRGREELFSDLGAAAAAARTTGQADFHAANLRRRHGSDPLPAWGRRARARLHAWGFNTVGNWSADAAFAGGDIPWVTALRGLDGWCHHVPDVFDPAFPGLAADAVRAQVAAHAHDPALIGYFVGNEPTWTFPGAIHPLQTAWDGRHPHTAAAALAWLRERYGGSAEALGAAWGIAASWDGLARSGPPDPRAGGEALRRDAEAFAGRILARFYEACCGAVRDADPGRLLLGARFYSVDMPEPYLRACSVFDVVSFNCYQAAPPPERTARLAELSGRPALIGEFHFGVASRGHSGALITVPDDAARGSAYEAYVRAAAADPALVGCHWFQWVDEPVTGRFDGEDYNIGLVDVADVPYAGLVAGARRAHEQMYRVRFG